MRADKAPTDGYSLVVDGHFKSHHATVEAAEEAGMAFKNQYQMLQVQIYDAATKTRAMVEWPAPAERPVRKRSRPSKRPRSGVRRFAGPPANLPMPGLFPLASSAWRGPFWPWRQQAQVGRLRGRAAALSAWPYCR